MLAAHEGRSLPRSAHDEADYPAARAIADALAWADVYLLSDLDESIVEDLGVIPLTKPADARRLIEAADSIAVVSQADRGRADVLDD